MGRSRSNQDGKVTEIIMLREKQINIFIFFTLFMTTCIISYAILIGYSAVYLQAYDFNNTQIGIYYSGSALLCVLLQGRMGSFLDRSRRFSSRDVLFLLNFCSICCVAILFLAKAKPLILITYILVGGIHLSEFTICSAFAMEYINGGENLNYALTRGISSIFFASATLGIGFLVEKWGVRVIFPLYCVCEILLLAALFYLPKPAKVWICKGESAAHADSPNTQADKKMSQQGGYIAFFRDKLWLLVLFVSILLIYTSYTAANNFQINIIQSVGGTSRHYGISAAIGGYVELPATLLFMPISKRIGYKRLLGLSCFFFLVKIGAFTLATCVWQVYLAQCCQFLSYAFFTPAVAYYINSVLDVKDQSKGQALVGIFTIGLSGVISSLTSGLLLDIFGVHTLLIFECFLCLIGLIGMYSVFYYSSNHLRPGKMS